MQETTVLDRTGNPAPLGLMGFGMTTILLNLHNAGFIALDTMILSMGIFYGGIAQVIAGIMEWKKGNTFACTAFTSYGMFWLSLVALVTLPKAGLGPRRRRVTACRLTSRCGASSPRCCSLARCESIARCKSSSVRSLCCSSCWPRVTQWQTPLLERLLVGSASSAEPRPYTPAWRRYSTKSMGRQSGRLARWRADNDGAVRKR